MQVSNSKTNSMQEGNESSVRKVNKNKINTKMNKNQNAATNKSSTPDNSNESPQNVRLDTSESEEESVSEESFPGNEPEDDISTEEFPEDEESCESENDDSEESCESGDDQENSDEDSDDDDITADEEQPQQPTGSGPAPKFLLNVDDDHPQYSKQARIDAILEAAAASKDKKGNPVLRSATAALEETAQTITRMRTERNDGSPRDKTLLSRTLIAACTDNDVNAVRRLLVEGNNLNEATDDGDSLLSLACSAGYYELAQVLLAMSAQVEDRGQKNDCTPLMEAASAGHIEIIELLLRHGADVNAQSSTGNTPLMYACAGGHVEAVKVLLAHGANVEDHNENGHTPLMEAASAGHVAVAKILLEHGAGINTHSNEFKESALTLACYKGHLDMVRFLLEAGADQEHKTDEMHTALMEASMDGHVEVARLLLDSGAQVNMPTDSFESPLTLAACGGHVDLAMLLIERGANIEEVNDEGYTPLMEAAREGHEEMVSLLLTQGANINAQTEETQETALTLACCGGFLEVADYLIKHGADIELGASTPLMEAAQEGHLELVKFLLDNKADVHAQTQTGDTALTYACENGHTDVAEVLLYFGAELEHLSEGGRTPLMKACRAGHICTVKFLIQKGADVNRQTTNNDHTPLSLACAGGHQQVVELLLAHGADPYHKLKDNSTMLIEAAKGGHTGVVQLLLDYPTSIPPPQNQQTIYLPTPMTHQAAAAMTKMNQQQFMVAPPGLHEVAEVIRLQEPPGIFQSQAEMMQNQNFIIDPNVIQQHHQQAATEASIMTQMKLLQSTGFKDGLAYGLTKGQNAVNQMIQNTNNMNVAPCAGTTASVQQQHQMISNNLCMPSSSTTTTASASTSNKQKNNSRKQKSSSYNDATVSSSETRGVGVGEEENILHIKSSLDKLDNTLQKNIQFINDSGPPPTLLPSATLLPSGYVDITTAAQNKGINFTSNNNAVTATPVSTINNNNNVNQAQAAPTGRSQITAKSEVSQATAISDRPKAKAKLSRKHQQQQQQQAQSGTTASQTITLVTDLNQQIPQTSQQQQQNQQKSQFELLTTKIESDIKSEVPQSSVPEAIPTSSLQAITQAAAALALDDKEKTKQQQDRPCSLVDFESFQKTPLNNLSNRSAHWDPKVFRKIAQLIDPPKSPPESPKSRPSSPDEKRFENELTNHELKLLLEEAISYKREKGAKGRNQGQFLQNVDEGLEKTLATFRSLNTEDFVCDGSFEESLESFNPEDVASATDDASGQIINYEWVDEVMQALNVSPDISSAFHEIAANINNQDFDYASILGLKSICQSKWATPHWPAQHHHGALPSGSSSPTNENDENIIMHAEGSTEDDGKHQDGSNLLMIDQSTGYPPQFTMEQLQLLSQFQQQHPLLQIDPQAAQHILMPAVPPPPVITPVQIQQMKSIADAQQQTKFVFNVDGSASTANLAGDKTSQSLQLLFQLPTDQQQAIVAPQQPQQVMKAPQQNGQQNVAQTQTLPVVANAQATTIQLPPPPSSGFLNFQQQPIPSQPVASSTVSNQQQKVHQLQFKANYHQQQNQQQVQVATQTQASHHHHPAAESLPHATPTSGKSVVPVKKLVSDSKRKDKSSRYARQTAAGQNQFQYDQQQLQYANNNIPGSTSTGTTVDRSIEIDSETDSNHDTALTLACAGGHEELVELLLSRKANIEHRDKKGFTPLILAATAGHEKVVEILINAGADLEAQSERTKDTPLSLACSGGRYEVVELLLKFNANKEHRNVSDYTPLSLAASGGYVNIIKLLLNHGAEINSRTGSKLGISPLMLAAMNGHTAAVRLLLDMGSDINAQIETNRNTALTLACFQGRHEVVSLLLDRKANVEHRAKTGLTPLMEAASGGYIEVGRVLLDKGADVNAPPVPSSRDTALTIAADKGHLKFVELLLSRGAAVEVKNKKGNSPLWLAANGGHLGVVEALYHAKADIDSQDNRKVSCLMAAFKKGHVKVVKWMVNHVTQFPSDQEMTRQISVVDKEVVEKCHECVKIIRAAKETQAAKANINASILLKELDMEKSREDARKAAAAKRRERKKRRKQEKREAQRKANGEPTTDNKQQQGGKNKNQKNQPEEPESDSESEHSDEDDDEMGEMEIINVPGGDKEEGDSGIDQGSCSSSDAKGTTSTHVEIQPPPPVQSQQQQQTNKNQKNKNINNNRKQSQPNVSVPATTQQTAANKNNNSSKGSSNRSSSSPVPVATKPIEVVKNVRDDSKRNRDQKNQRSADLTTKTSNKPTEKENVAPAKITKTHETSRNGQNHRKSLVFGNSTRSTADDYEIDYFKPTAVITQTTSSKPKTTLSPTKVSTSSSVPNSASKQPQPPREEEWKEVGGGKKVVTSTSTSSSSSSNANEIGCKKIQVPLNAISRVIGRGGSNINAIRAATGAHIEVEKQGPKTQADRSITIKGVPEATKQAHSLISTLIKDPDADILSMLPRNNFPSQSQPVVPPPVVTSTTQQPTPVVNTTARSSSSTNIISPSSIAAINNGTSVWEKSRDTIPTVTNPVKPASYSAKQPTTTVPAQSTTPTNKTPRAVAKNLFSNTSTNNVIMRPTPTSTVTTKIVDKKGIIASNGPPKVSSTNVGKNTSFAAQLGGNNSEELPAPFTNPIVASAVTSSTTPTTLTRSITPIGPPTRNFNASPHSSHIVNTLDLSTPYNNEITTQIQSKLGELHVSAQSGLEYSLFDMGSKWSQEQTNVFHQLNVSEVFEPPQLQVDASILAKAPGYRGGAINSPVSSKTSSNSATPPSTVLATQAPTAVSQAQSSNYDMNVIKPIGSGQRQQQQQNYRDRSLFEQYNNPDNSFSRQMNYTSGINPAMSSRLNPKASAFSSSSKMSNNSQQPQYPQQYMNSSSNNNFLKSPGSQQGYNQQRNAQQNTNASSSRWFGDLGSSFNDFSSRKNYGDELSSGMDSSLMSGNTSQMHQQGGAAMSPNNNSMNGPNLSGLSTLDDLRKAPPPIGTERHTFNKYNSYQQYPGMGGNIDFDNSMMNTQMPPNTSWMDKSPQQQWQMPSNVPIIPRSHFDTTSSMNDYSMPPDLFQQQYPMDHGGGGGYMRNGSGNAPYGVYMNDLSNLASDLQQPSYEKQPWASKWTH